MVRSSLPGEELTGRVIEDDFLGSIGISFFNRKDASIKPHNHPTEDSSKRATGVIKTFLDFLFSNEK